MLVRVIIYILVIYFVYLTILFIFQRHMLYPGQYMQSSAITDDKSSTYKSVWLPTSSGDVEAWFIPSKTVADDTVHPVVIFAHGNGELIDHWPHFLSPYNRLGLHILLVEFPGYGRSQGSPSQKSISEVFKKAYDWVITQKTVDKDRIIVHGRSVGGGAACLLAKDRAVKALILQSTFTSLKQFAIRFLAPPFLIRDSFDNLSVIKTFPGPILFIHGKNDEVIPYKNSVVLSQHARNAQLITYDCHHNDCPPDWDLYWININTFLKENSII